MFTAIPTVEVLPPPVIGDVTLTRVIPPELEAGVAHDPSPLQNVDEDALAAPARLVTGMLPVKLTTGLTLAVPVIDNGEVAPTPTTVPLPPPPEAVCQVVQAPVGASTISPTFVPFALMDPSC